MLFCVAQGLLGNFFIKKTKGDNMILLILFLILFYTKKREKNSDLRVEKKEKKTRRSAIDFIVKVAIFGTIASLLYTVPFLQFKLPFFPPFLELQFSNLPGILAGFILGPVGGSLVIVIKTIVKLPMSGTMFVGEAADLIIGVATVVASSLIYRKHRTIKGGLIALAVGAEIWIEASVFANFAVLIRWYAYLAGGMETIINLCKSVVPFINANNFYLVYLLCCCLPFNGLLAITTMVITFIVYKHVSRIFQKDFFKK